MKCRAFYRLLNYKHTLNQCSLLFTPSHILLTDSDGFCNLPDNVLMLVSVTSTKDENWLIEELGKFILFIKGHSSTHRIRHFAIGFSKDKFDHPATVQAVVVTSIGLY